jgi:hypothetical protein
MEKMKNLTVVEEEMFKFLRKSFQISRKEIKSELEKLLSKIKHLEYNHIETRSFAYLDIISWLESKLQDKTMSEIIHTKYLRRKARKVRIERPVLLESSERRPACSSICFILL